MAKAGSKTLTGSRRYWLFKSEPEAFSIHDLNKAPKKTTCWDGVRNYQARNLLRDEIQIGDRGFFYHSNADPTAIAGTVEIVRAGYPDHTAFDPDDPHYDPKSRREAPTWYMVDVRLLQILPMPVTRDALRSDSTASQMMVLRRGARLSVQPVTAEQWRAVHRLAGVKDPA